jgi:hypothetical protein
LSRFREAIIGNHEFAVKYGRPKADLPIDKILELSSKGDSCRDIAKKLGKLGIKTSKDTVNRLIRKERE